MIVVSSAAVDEADAFLNASKTRPSEVMVGKDEEEKEEEKEEKEEERAEEEEEKERRKRA